MRLILNSTADIKEDREKIIDSTDNLSIQSEPASVRNLRQTVTTVIEQKWDKCCIRPKNSCLNPKNCPVVQNPIVQAALKAVKN